MNLSWEYDASCNERVAEYRGFKIRAVPDPDAENPFTAWEGEPPTLVYRGRRTFDDYTGADDLENPLSAMSDAKVSRHWRAISKALDVAPGDHDKEAREYARENRCSLVEARRDMFEAYRESAHQGSGTDYFESLAELWRIAGCVAEVWASRGYSQGQWADGLTVATPAWVKKIGAPRDTHQAQCEHAGKLYGYWAWGDVYGFIIEGPDGTPGDSVWGHYGDDFAESGMEEAARAAIDSVIADGRRARQAKAAELIRARVPLHLRPAILDATASA